jgi:pyruvate dehydrogenase complex dehydrogenase (E1) component
MESAMDLPSVTPLDERLVARIRCLEVTEFGQSSDLHDTYRLHLIDTGSIADAALALLSR